MIRPYLNTTISTGLYDLRKIVSDRRFNAAKPTVLYVHGWEELLTQYKVEVIPRSYAARGGWNVILLNWDRFATGNYVIVWYNFIQVSGILWIFEKSFDSNFDFMQVVQNCWTSSFGCIQQTTLGY